MDFPYRPRDPFEEHGHELRGVRDAINLFAL
jgi:hypothetical protein